MIRKVTGTKFDQKVVEALERIVDSGKLRIAPALEILNCTVSGHLRYLSSMAGSMATALRLMVLAPSA